MVVVPAALGATLITTLCAYAVLNQIFGFVEPLNDNGDFGPTGGPAAWALWAAYAPLIAWGPLVTVLSVAYRRRRRANDASAAAGPGFGAFERVARRIRPARCIAAIPRQTGDSAADLPLHKRPGLSSAAPCPGGGLGTC
ncbi:hypothetical protein [Streptomyces erythrochromogenes]|uniref:hypothetical protein n=1 Tax=Streptomyces erythrochromogenes TaxID=285574 RepID=UPI003868D965|nr:hypothetical protein OG489_00680 [Streptomyces erythrochromogenes]WSR88236.1 hypothetical protein OG489_39280 [Streptomyces erythrochromogenes]